MRTEERIDGTNLENNTLPVRDSRAPSAVIARRNKRRASMSPLAPLRPARPDETENAQPAENSGGHQPAAGRRNVEISPIVAHPFSPSKEKAQEGEGEQ